MFNIFGNPKEIVSNRGTAFTSTEFADFAQEIGIVHHKVAVAAPWANGMVERANRFLKASLTRVCDGPQDWIELLSKIQYVVNNTINTSIGSTPSKFLLGYDQRNHSDAILKDLVTRLAKIERDLPNDRESDRKSAVETTMKLRNYNKVYYDKKHKMPTKYKIGDYVLIRNVQAKEGGKLKPKYKGPYIVSKTLDKNRYVV